MNYQNIIHSNIRKILIECQPESVEKSRLLKAIKSKLSTKFARGSIRKFPSTTKFEVAER